MALAVCCVSRGLITAPVTHAPTLPTASTARTRKRRFPVGLVAWVTDCAVMVVETTLQVAPPSVLLDSSYRATPDPPRSLPDQVRRRGIGSQPAATPVATPTLSPVTVGATRSRIRTRAATAPGGPVNPSPVTLSGSRLSASVPSLGASA